MYSDARISGDKYCRQQKSRAVTPNITTGRNARRLRTYLITPLFLVQRVEVAPVRGVGEDRIVVPALHPGALRAVEHGVDDHEMRDFLELEGLHLRVDLLALGDVGSLPAPST